MEFPKQLRISKTNINNVFIINLTQTCNKVGNMSSDHFEALCCSRCALILSAKQQQALQKHHFDVIFKITGDPFASDKIDLNVSYLKGILGVLVSAHCVTFVFTKRHHSKTECFWWLTLKTGMNLENLFVW